MAEAALKKSIGSATRRDRWILGAVLMLGLALTAGCTRLAWYYREIVQQRHLIDVAREIESRLSRQAGAAEAFVATVAAFVESSVAVQRAEFASFAGRTARLWPGLVAVEWQAWVPREKRTEFEAGMQGDIPGFRIVERDAQGRLVPAADRDIHLPVVHAYSSGVTMTPPGLDLAANREWFEAKLAAIDAPTAVASPSFGILNAEGRGIGEGFSISDAVFAPGTDPAQVRLRGFVSAVFAYRPMIHAALAGLPMDRLRVTVRDSAEIAPIYFSWPADDARAGATARAMRTTSTVRMAGRSWEISITAMPGLFAPVVLGLPWFVLGVGLLSTLGGTTTLLWRLRLRGERTVRAAERLAIERRFRDIVDRMSGAVLVVRCDAAGHRQIVEHNAAATHLFGHAPDPLLGRPLSEVMPEPAMALLGAAIDAAVHRDGVHPLELTVTRPQSGVRWLEGSVFRIGEADEICAVLQDLTDLKAAESALRQARDELELALDVSRVGLWSWDTRTQRIRLDVRCARLFGLPGAGEFGETEIASRVHPEDLKIVRDETERALRDMRPYEVEYRFTLADGTLRFLCTRGRPMKEGAGPATKFVGCSWDVTERRRMEEHLRRTQRLESLGTLAGGVAHDLNNALAPVTMGLDLLRRRLGADAEAVESVKLMQTSVRRASSIVRQLIAFKRGAGESRQPDPAHPKRILESLGTTLVESFPKEIAVLIEPASLDLPRIVADEREAHQVLLNLCINARDAMPQGGRLVIACDSLEAGPASQTQFPELRPGSYVVFSVSDTGCGISPEIRHRVFDPFFTTKEVGKGSGLGLSTALGIVRAHRGAIQFESREGGGTTFRVAFPALADDEPAKTVPVAPMPTRTDAAPQREPCLLLVDDEHQVRELARRALEQSGFKVLIAANGREAVEVFTEHIQSIDAVIMDLLMPVMNGAAATAAIKRLRPDVPIVGASGFATDALVEEAKAAGITAFLPKPFSVAILVDAVRAALVAKPG